MKRKQPDEGNELFERDPKTGRKTDARIWSALLGDDTRDTFDVTDPKQREARLKAGRGR